MQIGWVDFSKDERSKVLSIIDMLSEQEAVDELGIGTIRDGFSHIFFPGVTSVQTRAKYYLIVPYILSELEQNKNLNEDDFLEELDDTEKKCAQKLLETGSDSGVIGSRSIKRGGWVKRTPSDIYWNGLRTYGIFTDNRLSLSEYVHLVCELNAKKQSLKSLGKIYHNKNKDENDFDDLDAYRGIYNMHFWKLPGQVSSDWFDRLKIELTASEAAFLKRQIVESCGDSLLGFVLKNERRDFIQLQSFEEIGNAMSRILPGNIARYYRMAKGFADFIQCAYIRYNVVLSQEKSQDVLNEWKNYALQMKDYAKLDISEIVNALGITNGMLVQFLGKLKGFILKGDTDGIDKLVKSREAGLKGSARAKLCHADEFDYQGWVGIYRLQYLFINAKRIIEDIFTGEDQNHA